MRHKAAPRQGLNTQHDPKEVSWDALSPDRSNRIPRWDRPRSRGRAGRPTDKRTNGQAGGRVDAGNAAHERGDECHELRPAGLCLAGNAEAHDSARTERLPRLVRWPHDERDDAAASKAGSEAVNPRSRRRPAPDDGTIWADAPAYGRADDDEPRNDACVHEEGHLSP